MPLRIVIQRRCEPSRFGLVRISIFIAFLIFYASPQIGGQTSTRPAAKLPSAERVVERYLKAIGGKKRVAAIRDATHDWIIELNGQTMGKSRTQIKAPSSSRSEMTFGNGQIINATNSSSAWVQGLDGRLQTLTGSEALAAKLQGILAASHLVDYKKASVLGRTVALDRSLPEHLYKLEFSMRNGARLQYSFSAKTHLLIEIKDEVRNTLTRLEEYRGEQGILEPHRLRVTPGGSGELTFVLQQVSYNTGINDVAFHPVRESDPVDVPALLRAVGQNQDELEERVAEYSFRQKETDRQIDDKGVVKKEKVKVYEIFPLINRRPVQKLISEDGVPLNAERAAKEEKRVQEEFLKAEREREKDKQEKERRRADAARKREDSDDDPEISQFLKACEFVSPRREKFDNREAIVFDFRPRQGFRPGNRQESLIAKLVGAVWIDPLDKQVMRLEARLAEGFKMAGGLLLSLRPGAALVIEQTRVAEGVWLPKFAQINLSVKVLLFGGGDYNKTIEWSDYRHFQGEVGDYKLDAPKPEEKKNP
jgi:hypothetical protein